MPKNSIIHRLLFSIFVVVLKSMKMQWKRPTWSHGERSKSLSTLSFRSFPLKQKSENRWKSPIKALASFTSKSVRTVATDGRNSDSNRTVECQLVLQNFRIKCQTICRVFINKIRNILISYFGEKNLFTSFFVDVVVFNKKIIFEIKLSLRLIKAISVQEKYYNKVGISIKKRVHKSEPWIHPNSSAVGTVVVGHRLRPLNMIRCQNEFAIHAIEDWKWVGRLLKM